MSDIAAQKQTLRLKAKEKRAKAEQENPDAGLQLRDVFLKEIALPNNSVVACFKSFGSEIDTDPLIHSLQMAGHTIVLPVVVGAEQGLAFHLYRPDDKLIANKYGIKEPSPSSPDILPDIILVPLLAFDRQLHRLGYGGGYYDRTINEIRQRKKIITIGLAYSRQAVAELPKDLHDVQLDMVVTEVGVSYKVATEE